MGVCVGVPVWAWLAGSPCYAHVCVDAHVGPESAMDARRTRLHPSRQGTLYTISRPPLSDDSRSFPTPLVCSSAHAVSVTSTTTTPTLKIERIAFSMCTRRAHSRCDLAGATHPPPTHPHIMHFEASVCALHCVHSQGVTVPSSAKISTLPVSLF
jgi:hypothetical protein